MGVVFRGDGRILSSDQLSVHEHSDRAQTLDVAPRIYEEYRRTCQMVGEEDQYVSNKALGIHEVLKAHFLIADFFYAEGEGMGGIGLMNINALHSALYRQHVALGGVKKWQSRYEICATLLFGLIKNHPFRDGNKRTALLSSLYFLYKNKLVITVSHQKLVEITVEIAEIKSMNGSADREIKRIAKILKNSTRDLDKRYYTITYKQLDKILKRFDFYLGDKRGNVVEVMKMPQKKRGIFGFPKNPKKITQIGFPGETKQVSKIDIKKVREETGLTHRNGIDSKVFFKGLERTDELLAHYQDALRQLADR